MDLLERDLESDVLQDANAHRGDPHLVHFEQAHAGIVRPPSDGLHEVSSEELHSDQLPTDVAAEVAATVRPREQRSTSLQVTWWAPGDSNPEPAD